MAAADAQVRHSMNVEDEYFSAIERRDTELMLKDKQLAEKTVLLAEKDGLLAEKDGQLAEKDGQLAEKDGQLAEKDEQLAEKDGQLRELLRSSVLTLHKAGLSPETIAWCHQDPSGRIEAQFFDYFTKLLNFADLEKLIHLQDYQQIWNSDLATRLSRNYRMCFAATQTLRRFWSSAPGRRATTVSAPTLIGKNIDYRQLLDISMEIDDLELLYSIDLLDYQTKVGTPIGDHIDRVGQVFYEAA